MVRQRFLPSDSDQDNVPTVPRNAGNEDTRPKRRAARDAHKAWEDIKPKLQTKGKEKNKKTGPKPSESTSRERDMSVEDEYAPPSIDLNTSNDESSSAPGVKKVDAPRTNKEMSDDMEDVDEAPVKSRKSKSSESKGKGKARSSEILEEESSDNEPDEKAGDDDESSGPSGLEELERKDPSALQAKFDGEVSSERLTPSHPSSMPLISRRLILIGILDIQTASWVNDDDDDFNQFDRNLFASSSSIHSPGATATVPDVDHSPAPSKPKRPRADSLNVSENEQSQQSQSRPAKKKAKAVPDAKGVDDGSGADQRDSDDSAPSKSKARDLAKECTEAHQRERRREEDREHRREDERECKKTQDRVDRAKERAQERERQRRGLEEYRKHEKEHEREEEDERKREEEHKRIKEREREKERRHEQEVSRKIARDRRTEREYEREHEEVRKQLRGKHEDGKDHGRKQREQERMDDELEQERDKSHRKYTMKAVSQGTTGSSHSSVRSQVAGGSRTVSARGSSQATLKKTTGLTQSSNSRKRRKQDEEICFVSNKDSSSSDKEPPSQRRRQDVDEQPSSDADDTSVDLVSIGSLRPNLTSQHPRVRQVATLAIADCELNVCTLNAFPDDPDEEGFFARDILIKHAKALSYKAMVKTLKDKKDSTYLKKLSTIPAQRVYILRGKVKSKCEGAVRAAYNLAIGDSGKVAWLQKDLTYIYPHDYEKRTVVGKEGFKPPIFENMLMASFFSKRNSYRYRIMKHFTSSHPDKPDEKEIPAPMLALVSTAIFTAIDDFKSERYEAAKFEVNSNLHVYRRNMSFLNHIKDKNIDAYHALMHGLYRHIVGGRSNTNDTGHGMGYLDVDGMECT